MSEWLRVDPSRCGFISLPNYKDKDTNNNLLHASSCIMCDPDSTTKSTTDKNNNSKNEVLSRGKAGTTNANGVLLSNKIAESGEVLSANMRNRRRALPRANGSNNNNKKENGSSHRKMTSPPEESNDQAKASSSLRRCHSFSQVSSHMFTGTLLALFFVGITPYLSYLTSPQDYAETFHHASFDYDVDLSHFDNTIWTWGTDYGLAIAMGLLFWSSFPLPNLLPNNNNILPTTTPTPKQTQPADDDSTQPQH
jgi:hypothetical protein